MRPEAKISPDSPSARNGRAQCVEAVRERLAETQAREHAPKSRAWAKCRREVQTAVQQLEALTALQPTVERHNLVGSAWKRLSMLLRGSDNRGAADARARSDAAYGRAEAMALEIWPSS